METENTQIIELAPIPHRAWPLISITALENLHFQEDGRIYALLGTLNIQLCFTHFEYTLVLAQYPLILESITL